MAVVDMAIHRSVAGVCPSVVVSLPVHSGFVACVHDSSLSMSYHLPLAGVQTSAVPLHSTCVCVGSIFPMEDCPHRRSHCHCGHFHTVQVAAVCHLRNLSPSLAGDLC